jgi:spore maturation protein CgeB
MKPAREWADDLASLEPCDSVERIEGRGGRATLKSGGVYLHSRYDPEEEAARLIDSAELDPSRPVLVVGMGLGYHVAELIRRGAPVAAVEPDPCVAKLAIDERFAEATFPLAVGDAAGLERDAAFCAFARTFPQLLVHPPTARLHPGFAESVEQALSRTALSGQRLHIAVVGPMFGGSAPIAGHLERAFRGLGHTTLFVDNTIGYSLYQAMSKSVKSKQAANQLGNLLVHWLGEWTYAQVAAFRPDLCFVLAQAPVNVSFPGRLAKEGVVTAYWFVENWRHMDYWRAIAPAYDYFFHIQPGHFDAMLDAIGCVHHAYVQTGCDPEVHRPVTLTAAELDEYGCDISFAGAGYPNRNSLFAGLTDYHFKIWGVDWSTRELNRLVVNPGKRFSAETFARIAAGSKINLNLHASTAHLGVDPECDALNPRVFEIAASGGFQLCDPCAGLEAHFDLETELPVYDTLAGLRAQIDYYLAHSDERRQIAVRARERALRDHTYRHRAEQMLGMVLDAHGGRILRKGVRAQQTMAEMADRVGRETALGAYLATLPPDLPFTHEQVNQCLAERHGSPSEPEAIFRYLGEVRTAAEGLLEQIE